MILKNGKVFCVIGDGELQEGQIWEALMTASFRKLDNLVILFDRNKYQLDSSVESEKGEINLKIFAEYGFNVYEVSGHDIYDIVKAYEVVVENRIIKDDNSKILEYIKNKKDMPTIIAFNTVKGKGVSFMENTNKWHGKVPNLEEYELAKKELGE